MDKIATLVALKNRSINIDDTRCTLCNDVEETIYHLFTSCLILSVLWTHICY
ncbi:putative reverse transcriptase zinc-binding domain-containing protein [Helianthus annuus]|nr:putative reverse transcriptase zinc-binding domain-containing protein [Helianthus annuus]